jgi:ribosomal protein S18 acetylase RimI-like enzyme
MATLNDVNELLRIEAVSFVTDRCSRRAFRHLVTRANGALLLVTDGADGGSGYAALLFRRGSPRARLYSIAIDPVRRGEGLGSRLLAAAEATARDRRCSLIGLEVHAGQPATRAFYAARGYRECGMRASYYGDGGDAVLMEKALDRAIAVPSTDPGQ